MGRKGETMRVLRRIILICFLCIGISAQQTTAVSGQLKDGGRVVANQLVRLISGNESYETKTDAGGNYRFANVADGRYLLVFNNKQASVYIKGGQVSIAELAEVVQISANTTQTIEQVSKTVDVIDNQELRDRADFSLAESLDDLLLSRRADCGTRIRRF